MCTHYLFHVKNKSFHALCSKAHYAPVTDRSTLMTSLYPDTLGWMWYVSTHRTEYHLQITSKRKSRSAKQHLITSGNIAEQNAVGNPWSISYKCMYDMYVRASKSWNPKCTLTHIYGHLSLKSAIMVVPCLQIHYAIATNCSSALQRCTTSRNFHSTPLLQLQWTGIKVAIQSSNRSIAQVNQ